ncbi:phosphatidate cytidylyltransferase [Geobacter sp. OR-1]|nr:phosphatidate cytidylyltransferase [Geobacter sp. OR-1]
MIALIVKGSQSLFAAFVIVVAFLGLLEFYRMALLDRNVEAIIASVIGAPLVLFPLFCPSLLVPGLTSLVLVSALALLFRFRDIRQAAQEWALLSAGFLYVPLLLSQLLLLRSEPFGPFWILLMMLIVMAGDSAAYYIGSAFGRNKLYPAVSPNKSIEGAVGGLAGSVAGAFIAKFSFFPQLGAVDCIAAAVALGILGQLGDLFESLLKRSCGVKDSGAIIPGHGGMLDRLDSILFAAPAAWWYAHFIFSKG